MKTMRTSSPFGGATRTRALLALQLLGESHVRELARVIGASHSGVLSALAGLERDGIVAARLVGRAKAYRVDPRYFAAEELAAYLARLVEGEPELRAAVAALRRRPRRAGKPL